MPQHGSAAFSTHESERTFLKHLNHDPSPSEANGHRGGPGAVFRRGFGHRPPKRQEQIAGLCGDPILLTTTGKACGGRAVDERPPGEKTEDGLEEVEPV